MKGIRNYVLAAFCFCFCASQGQSFTVDFIEFSGRNIVVHYTLDDGANSTRQFLVQLYSSQDNYTTPLTRVTGDVGTEVAAGFDKKIVWDVTKEIGDFDGIISLEIRGRVYVPFVKLSMREKQVFKRGRNYPLNWTSGNLSGMVNLELFNAAGERMWGENNVSNVGKYDWFIPGSVKQGSGYRLKFTNTKDRNDVVYSLPFIVKPKIPFWVKVASGVVVGATSYYISTKASSSNKPKPYPDPISPN